MQLGLVETGQDGGDVAVRAVAARVLGRGGNALHALGTGLSCAIAGPGDTIKIVEHAGEVVLIRRGRRRWRRDGRPLRPYGPRTQRLGDGQQPCDPLGQGLLRHRVPVEGCQLAVDDDLAFLHRGPQRRHRIGNPVPGRGPQQCLQRRRGVPETGRGPAEQVHHHRGTAPGVIASGAHHPGEPIGLGEFGLTRGEQRPRVGAQRVGDSRPELVHQPAHQARRQVGRDEQLRRGVGTGGCGEGVDQPPGPDGGDPLDGCQAGHLDIGRRADPGLRQARGGRAAQSRPQPGGTERAEHGSLVGQGRLVGDGGLGRHAGSLAIAGASAGGVRAATNSGTTQGDERSRLVSG